VFEGPIHALATQGPGAALEHIRQRGLITIPTPDRRTFANAVSLKAIAGPLGRPFEIGDNPDARRAIVQNLVDVGTIGDDRAVYSASNNPKWKGHGSGRGGYDASHKIFGQFVGDVMPGRNGGRDVIVTRDMWDTNQPSAVQRPRYEEALRSGNVFDIINKWGVLQIAERQESGSLNRLPMGERQALNVPEGFDPRSGPEIIASALNNGEPWIPREYVENTQGNENFPMIPQSWNRGRREWGRITDTWAPPGAASGQAPQRPTPAGTNRAVELVRTFSNLTPQISRGSSYEVAEGDNLWSISRKTGRSVEELARASGISDPNMIMPGQRIQF
jgi:hypothetical protein